MNKIISLISKSALYLLGWKPLEYKVLEKLNHHQYMICVFSHTSYYDFFFMVLYYLSYPKELQNLKTVIKPDYFEYIGWFLTKVGGIPSTHINQKNGGATEKIVNILQSYPQAQLLISPKGTILKGEWRTGYYYIAQALKAPLIAIGVDYEEKKINIGDFIDYQLDEFEIKARLYQDLGKIVPLYPDREMMKIRPHLKQDVNVLHPDRLLGFYFIMTCVIGIFVYKKS